VGNGKGLGCGQLFGLGFFGVLSPHPAVGQGGSRNQFHDGPRSGGRIFGEGPGTEEADEFCLVFDAFMQIPTTVRTSF